jgi:hypothetical protein
MCETKLIRSIYLPSPTGRPPGLSTSTRPEARPPSPLSMPRLCAFVEQITLHYVIRSREESHIRGRSGRFVHDPG